MIRAANTLQAPRRFLTTGFTVIQPDHKLEEERLPCYRRDEYYPTKIGEVLHGHYQVVAKLGYGTTSTVWLSRDLRCALNVPFAAWSQLTETCDDQYWVLKIYIHNLKHGQELVVYQHLAAAPCNKPDELGFQNVRQAHESFQIKGPAGAHDVLVMKPLAGSWCHGAGLIGLSLLHEADVIHADIHADSLLIALADDSILAQVEQNEIDKPSARKQVGDNTIYVSQYMMSGRGALAWDLLEKANFFEVYDHESQEHNDACHLAAMTALIGAPPREFLERSPRTSKYWDKDGQWIDSAPLPVDRTFESLASTLEGKERDIFLNFIQCFVWWVPEERLTELQGYMNPFLRGGDLPADDE
ncbi:hypothetical protein NLG97_g9754 [Lecanicillium saksenae]|uniref:Uncharacterized protein n=1 Tax=Lecanicillium saksenae TaxID=468837 RepID=A0ACC1QHV1_9HYPO|nr:hypothetical protein NLG97_g9754 [Lecanicillium saksenae]